MTELEIEGIEAQCILGDLPAERETPQLITVDIVLGIDDAAAHSDDLADTVDYVDLARRVRETLVAAKCRLLERAARLIAESAMTFPHVRTVRAKVTKTGAVAGIRSASAVFALG